MSPSEDGTPQNSSEIAPQKSDTSRLPSWLTPKDLSAFVGVVALIGGAIAFFYHWHTDIDARNREARKPFLIMQLELYRKAVQATSSIVSLYADRNKDDTKAKYQESIEKFWELYFGELSIVESEDVETAMVLFGRSLTADLKQSDSPCALSKSDISLALDHCVRNSIADGWGLDSNSPHNYCQTLGNLAKACPE